MIDHEHQLIFLANRKTASVSIKEAMQGPQHAKSCDVEPGSCNHKTGAVISREYPELFATYHKFTVVRNSFDRAASYFHYHQSAPHLKNRKYYRGLSFGNWIRRGCPAPHQLKALMQSEGCADDALDQLRYADYADTVLRFENLESGWRTFARNHFIAENELPRRNDFHRPPAEWTPELVEIFAAKYAAEIKRFEFSEPLVGISS